MTWNVLSGKQWHTRRGLGAMSTPDPRRTMLLKFVLFLDSRVDMPLDKKNLRALRGEKTRPVYRYRFTAS